MKTPFSAAVRDVALFRFLARTGDETLLRMLARSDLGRSRTGDSGFADTVPTEPQSLAGSTDPHPRASQEIRR
jgi:hypothetical protein